MKTFLIFIGIVFFSVVVASLISNEPLPKSKPKRRRYSSSKPPKTLPWFDKDYLERKRRKENDIHF